MGCGPLGFGYSKSAIHAVPSCVSKARARDVGWVCPQGNLWDPELCQIFDRLAVMLVKGLCSHVDLVIGQSKVFQNITSGAQAAVKGLVYDVIGTGII